MIDSRKNSNRSFDLIASAALPIVLFGFWFGFWFTYWEPVVAGESFSSMVHVHAALWFGWFALLALQSRLIQTGNRQIHKRLGLAGVIYSLVLIVISSIIALQANARDVHLVTRALNQFQR